MSYNNILKIFNKENETINIKIVTENIKKIDSFDLWHLKQNLKHKEEKPFQKHKWEILYQFIFEGNVFLGNFIIYIYKDYVLISTTINCKNNRIKNKETEEAECYINTYLKNTELLKESTDTLIHKEVSIVPLRIYKTKSDVFLSLDLDYKNFKNKFNKLQDIFNKNINKDIVLKNIYPALVDIDLTKNSEIFEKLKELNIEDFYHYIELNYKK